MTEEELQAALEKSTSERDRYDLFVEECGDQDVRLRFSPLAGEPWSQPALMALLDTSLRAAAGVGADPRVAQPGVQPVARADRRRRPRRP